MAETPSHDLYNFMRQITDEMALEYSRIQSRAKEDPGTAGDQGEENWAELLKEWLPRSFEVVTKGRIIGIDGAASPQIDVLVLKGEYPKKLLNKKLYLAAGVAAAFECKTTLKAAHIRDAAEKCARIKGLYHPRTGSPYRELHSPLVYGILAHSHQWKADESTPTKNMEQGLIQAGNQFAPHPRLELDLACVADLGTWVLSKSTFIGPAQVANWSTMAHLYGEYGSGRSSYLGCGRPIDSEAGPFTPIGSLVSCLVEKLAWETPALRDLADYYRCAYLSGPGSAYCARLWPSDIYTEAIRHRVTSGMLSNGKAWDEWSVGFF